MKTLFFVIGLSGLLITTSYGESKKIISSGWGNQDTQFIKDNWQKMEEVPLDGMGIFVRIDRNKEKSTQNDLGWQVPSSTQFTIERFQETIADMKDVKFKKFTDNFLTTQWSSGYSSGLHWFDDERWNIFLNNLEVLTKIAKEIKTKGLIIDVEDYNYELFSYNFMNEKYYKGAWSEYEKKAYERGIQTIKSINKIYPDITLLFYYAWSLPINDNLINVSPEAQRHGLLVPFLDGMLSASTPKTIFVEGFEYSYSYQKEEAFVRARKLIKEEGTSLTKFPEKFEKQVQMGFALWIDNSSRWETEPSKISRNYFLPEEWANSLNFALKYSDEYVWIYSEKAKFFSNPNIPQSYLEVMGKVKEEKWQIQETKENKPNYYGFINLDLTAQKYIEGNPKHNEENTFKDLWGKYDFIGNLPNLWRFKLDPKNKGVEEKWFAKELEGSKDIEIEKWWEEEGYNYDGYAWYQTEFEVSKEFIGKKIYLAFGAVDESADVYVNGKLAGTHNIGEVGWDKKILIEITPHLVPDKENAVTVRVFDSSRYGGIWKPVKLISVKKFY